jgi:hypothetical protein
VFRALLDSLASTPLRCPPEFVGGIAELSSLFQAIGHEQQLPASYPQRIASLIPEPIRVLPCFLDRLTGVWRYDYGEPIEVGDRKVIGTHMFHEVNLLFEVVCCADWRLSPQKLGAYLARLSDRVRHEDVLVEFAPILRLGTEIAAEHEVAGHGDGNHTVDWSIHAPGHPKLLLEIKHRIGDLIESFGTFNAQGSDQSMQAPQHDHAFLFRNIERKFKPRPTDEAIQAVWIKTGLKQEVMELQAAFDALDAAKIHAAVLGGWGAEACVLARDEKTKRRVRKILGLRRGEGLVFDRADESHLA